MYYGDFCSDSVIEAEYKIWCYHVQTFEDKKVEVLKVLENCKRQNFPNINLLL